MRDIEKAITQRLSAGVIAFFVVCGVGLSVI